MELSSIPRRLNTLRDENGWSWQKLADELSKAAGHGAGFSTATLFRYANGKFSPRNKMLVKTLADALDRLELKQLEELGIEEAIDADSQRQRIQESIEDRYRSLYHQSSIMLQSVDRHGTLLSVNQFWLRKMGFSWDEVVGQQFVTFLDEKSKNEYENSVLQNLFSNPSMDKVSLNMITRAGGLLQVLLYPSFDRNNLEDARYSVDVLTDITEMHRIERALRKSESRLRAFAHAVPDISFILDEEGFYIEALAVEGKEGLLYQQADELKGKSLHEVLPAEIAQRFLEVIHQAIETQETQVLEYELPVLAGVLDFEGYVYRLIEPDEEKRKVVWVAHDVTERREAIKRLERSEGQFRLLVENAFDGIAVHVDRKFVYVNPAFVRTLAAGSAVELLGRSIFDFLHADYHAVAKEGIAAILTTQQPVEAVDSRLIRVDGQEIDVSISAIPMIFENQEAVQIIVRKAS